MEKQNVSRNIVIGQAVSEEKLMLARQMRRKMTPMEKKAWERLRGSQLGVNFRRQQVIHGFIADFYCHSACLVIEIDGSSHDPDYDAERDRIFATLGISVLRFTNQQIKEEISIALHQIRNFLRSRPQKPSTL